MSKKALVDEIKSHHSGIVYFHHENSFRDIADFDSLNYLSNNLLFQDKTSNQSTHRMLITTAYGRSFILHLIQVTEDDKKLKKDCEQAVKIFEAEENLDASITKQLAIYFAPNLSHDYTKEIRKVLHKINDNSLEYI